jgi:Zn-dependent M28 family amino/carboxypeptidase
MTVHYVYQKGKQKKPETVSVSALALDDPEIWGLFFAPESRANIAEAPAYFEIGFFAGVFVPFPGAFDVQKAPQIPFYAAKIGFVQGAHLEGDPRRVEDLVLGLENAGAL